MICRMGDGNWNGGVIGRWQWGGSNLISNSKIEMFICVRSITKRLSGFWRYMTQMEYIINITNSTFPSACRPAYGDPPRTYENANRTHPTFPITYLLYTDDTIGTYLVSFICVTCDNNTINGYGRYLTLSVHLYCKIIKKKFHFPFSYVLLKLMWKYLYSRELNSSDERAFFNDGHF